MGMKKRAAESGASAAVAVDHNDADSNLVESTKWIKKVVHSLITETRGTKIGTHGLGGEGRTDQFKSDGLEVEESRTALPIAKVMTVFQLKYKGVSYEKDVLSILNQKANERFKRTGNLQVLVFIGVTTSLPASLGSLTKLKTLCLNQCCLQDKVEIGALESLEILSFFQSSMKDFPSEIGQLTRLTSLELQIPEASILPSSMIFDKLEEYNIVIGDQWEWSDSNGTSRLLKLKLNPNIHLEQEIKAIVASAQDLYLEIDGLEQIWPDPLAVDQNIVYSSEKNEAFVSFPNLETMILDNLNNLEEICPEQPIIDSFQNLKVIKNIVLLDSGTTIDEIESIPVRSLTLQDLPRMNGSCCNDLPHHIPTLFPNEKALFGPLNHLKLISISRIKLLVITALSNGMVKSLILEELPKFSRFCQDGCTVKWLSLKTLKVDNCPMIQKSSLGKIERPLLTSVIVTDCKRWTSNDDPENNIAYLFHLTGQFPILEDLKIKDSEELKTYMEMKLQLTKLKTVEALQCDNELTRFLSILLKRSYKLEQLKVRNCELLEQVLDLEEFVPNKESYLKFPNLITMQLDGLPKLNCIWNKDPTGILRLGKLTKLEIIKCGLLKSPLTTPLLEELVSLEVLKLESCENIEFVVEDDKEERSFANLKDVHIASLPKLIKFNTGHCNFKFPNLLRLTIEECPELNAFTTGFLIKTTNEGTPSQVPSDEKMDVCPKLEKLKLVRNESFEEIWQTQGSHIPKCELKEIEVDSFSNLGYIFPSSMLQIMSEKLEKLVVRNCSSLSDVFQPRESDSIKAFENLKILTVKGCGSLQRLLLPSSYPNLTNIDISDCKILQEIFIDRKIKAEEKCFPNLKSIILENLPVLSSFSLELIEFPKLQKARIVNCPTIKILSGNVSDKAGNSIDTDSYKSRSFGHGKMKLRNRKPQIPMFQKLTSLEIVGCDIIEKLFSILMAQYLSSLKLLTLYKCENMVQVLHQDGRETSKQVFEKLETLVLKHLPNLTSFCEEDFDFGEFPELKVVRVENIPNMETFVKKPLNTPKLKQVHVTPMTKCWHQNLNQTIFLLHENHDKLKDDVWESDQSSTAHHTDDAESSSQVLFSLTFIACTWGFF
ncbi:hypothetical protein K1719_032916 [Acacia pycnantha]|nr:hypothetical protein K1719_032916 [Acacia pycnantha]